MARILISFITLVACCALALADTLNSFRRAHGLPALHLNRALQAMALRLSKSMAARHSVDHDGFYSERGRGVQIARVQMMKAAADYERMAQDAEEREIALGLRALAVSRHPPR